MRQYKRIESLDEKHKHDGKKMKGDKNNRCAHFEIQVKTLGCREKILKIKTQNIYR